MNRVIKKILIVIVTIGTTLANVGVYAVTGNEINDEQVSDALELQVGDQGSIKSSLEMKILPSINSTVIATIEENTEYSVIDIMNKWCYIQTPNYTGWVLCSKLMSEKPQTSETQKPIEPVESTESTEPTEPTGSVEPTENTVDTENTNVSNVSTVKKFVSTDTLNVRAEADTDANILTQVSINDEVIVLEEVDGIWSKIKFGDVTGYVASKYLSDTKTTITSRSMTVSRAKREAAPKTNTYSDVNNVSSAASTSGEGSAVVAYAKQYLGYRYSSGGSSPSTGFDCSGFTSYVYSHFGVNLSRTTSGQNQNGQYVDRGSLRSGDIVVFRNRSNSSIGHVGIYIGGNSFIHAENKKSGVCIGSLASSYYSARYVGARRVIN